MPEGETVSAVVTNSQYGSIRRAFCAAFNWDYSAYCRNEVLVDLAGVPVTLPTLQQGVGTATPNMIVQLEAPSEEESDWRGHPSEWQPHQSGIQLYLQIKYRMTVDQSLPYKLVNLTYSGLKSAMCECFGGLEYGNIAKIEAVEPSSPNKLRELSEYEYGIDLEEDTRIVFCVLGILEGYDFVLPVRFALPGMAWKDRVDVMLRTQSMDGVKDEFCSVFQWAPQRKEHFDIKDWKTFNKLRENDELLARFHPGDDDEEVLWTEVIPIRLHLQSRMDEGESISAELEDVSLSGLKKLVSSVFEFSERKIASMVSRNRVIQTDDVVRSLSRNEILLVTEMKHVV